MWSRTAFIFSSKVLFAATFFPRWSEPGSKNNLCFFNARVTLPSEIWNVCKKYRLHTKIEAPSQVENGKFITHRFDVPLHISGSLSVYRNLLYQSANKSILANKWSHFPKSGKNWVSTLLRNYSRAFPLTTATQIFKFSCFHNMIRCINIFFTGIAFLFTTASFGFTNLPLSSKSLFVWSRTNYIVKELI